MDDNEKIEHLKRLREDLMGNVQEGLIKQLEHEILKEQLITQQQQQKLLNNLRNYKEPCYRCGALLTREQYIGQKNKHFRFYCSDCLAYNKICKKCNNILDATHFQRLSSSKDRLVNTCDECLMKSKKNASEVKKHKQHLDLEKRLYNYGINSDDYLKMLELQDGLCAICKNSNKLVIDHCHNTNNVRGLLCLQCNSALGMFKDNINSLTSAIEYLNKAAIKERKN